MGATTQDLAHRKIAVRNKLAQLEKDALNDPLKRNRKLHEEIAELKKKLANM